MISENRDPAFWARIASHPEVAPHMGPVDWPGLIDKAAVAPLATGQGGYLFVRMDGLGRFYDLHAAFEPSGWGRVANHALRASLRLLRGWQAITSAEAEDNWRSRPPRSFGFRPLGGFEGGYRSWILTRAAWEASPAYRRSE